MTNQPIRLRVKIVPDPKVADYIATLLLDDLQSPCPSTTAELSAVSISIRRWSAAERHTDAERNAAAEVCTHISNLVRALSTPHRSARCGCDDCYVGDADRIADHLDAALTDQGHWLRWRDLTDAWIPFLMRIETVEQLAVLCEGTGRDPRPESRPHLLAAAGQLLNLGNLIEQMRTTPAPAVGAPTGPQG